MLAETTTSDDSFNHYLLYLRALSEVTKLTSVKIDQLTKLASRFIEDQSIDDINIIKKIYICCFLSILQVDNKEVDVSFNTEREIVRTVGDGIEYETDLCEMLSYINFHNNRGKDLANIEKWKLIPRYVVNEIYVYPNSIVDIIESYIKTENLFVDTTPLAKTEDEVMALVTDNRYNSYVDRNYISDSLIDFFLDYLLHICNMDHEIMSNSVLSSSRSVLVDIVIQSSECRKEEGKLRSYLSIVQCILSSNKCGYYDHNGV